MRRRGSWRRLGDQVADQNEASERIKVDAQQIVALKFKQWLATWDKYESVTDGKWRKPEPHIYMFSMRAGDLRNLSDVYRRKYEGDVSEGVQRAQDKSRTSRIQRYVQYGYPFGDLPAPMRAKPENMALRKPGWLPTSIVINILGAGDVRRGRKVHKDHLVKVATTDGGAQLDIPKIDVDADEYLAPFEVIDGQHRLWAFDNGETDAIPDDFELPVVAFRNLDISWQAYLFWSINVSPKRINKSHAFDLYPLLRTQDWLEQVGELNVYREARAQELTELMYTHKDSVWYHRVNMLGEKGGAAVSQNAWVKALTSSFLATGRGTGAKGLFQSNIGEDEMPLPWSRGQQGAFLIRFWSELRDEIVTGVPYFWIREYKAKEKAFEDKSSLLNQDMGLRAVLSLVNDIFVLKSDEWNLEDWRCPSIEDGTFGDEASAALERIDTAPFIDRVNELAKGLAEFDWRSLDGPNVKGTEEEVLKRSFRGSGGYTALKLEVLKVLQEQDGLVGEAAAELLESAA